MAVVVCWLLNVPATRYSVSQGRRNWQTKRLDTWKVTQLNSPRQKSVKSSRPGIVPRFPRGALSRSCHDGELGVDTVVETIDTVVDTIDTVVDTIDTVVATIDTVVETIDTVVETIDTVVETIDTVVETMDTVVKIMDTVVETIDTVVKTIEKP